MRELSTTETQDVNGGFLANVGMGVAGALMGMAGYSLQGGIRGQMSGSGFVGAGIAGFIYGASAFSPAGAIAGGAIGSGVEELIIELSLH